MMLTLMVSYCQEIVAVRDLSMASLYTVKDAFPPILPPISTKPFPPLNQKQRHHKLSEIHLHSHIVCADRENISDETPIILADFSSRPTIQVQEETVSIADNFSRKANNCARRGTYLFLPTSQLDLVGQRVMVVSRSAVDMTCEHSICMIEYRLSQSQQLSLFRTKVATPDSSRWDISIKNLT